MAVSQRSFENLYGRFILGVEVIRTSPEYTPLNNSIKITTLETFIADIAAKDMAVNLALEDYRNNTTERKIKSFKFKGGDKNCLENRIRNVLSYIGAEVGRDSAAYKIIKGFIQKLTPQYDKKDPADPRGKGKSPSEKSYVALLGYAKQTLELMTSLGAAYSPSNTYIQTAGFNTFLTEMNLLTQAITTFKKTYQDAVAAREKLYFGDNGIQDRTQAIKDYLASLPGGKKNQLYIDFVSAIKGK